MTREELIEKVKLLPYSPGVYMMKDEKENILYVGKSKSLRNRVGSYFQDPERLNIKTQKLVSHIRDFTCVYTDTETEALILENELIKRHKPKYNILLKDSKSYPYVKITNARFPNIVLSRTRKDDKCRYFGPYTSAKAVKDVIETVHRTFKTASCGKKFEEGKSVCRPCLNYHIGKCVAPCTGKITAEEYAATFSEIGDFLKGDYRKVTEQLKTRMEEASENLMFEAAAQYRDRLTALKRLEENQKILSDMHTDRDVFGLYESETLCVIAVLFIRTGRLIDKELIFFSPDELTDEGALSDLVLRYYSAREYIPKSVLLAFPVEERSEEDISEFLSDKAGHKVEVRTPRKGMAKDIAALACENARQAAVQYDRDVNRSMKVLTHLYQVLSLDCIPMRIEAYDISNHGTESMYAGMIVLENGNFKKSDYRCFSIKTVDGQDDYGAMREALTRRMEKLREYRESGENSEESFAKMPDLILLDGGKGHMSAVKPIIDGYGYPIATFGMIKDSFHKTRTLTDGENEIGIAHLQDIFTFIYKIQEEVHRYTFSRMDASRREKVKHSSLEDIEGIGKAKAALILKHFKTLAAVKRATTEELMQVKGVSRAVAENIVSHYAQDARSANKEKNAGNPNERTDEKPMK